MARITSSWAYGAALFAGLGGARVDARPRPPVTPCEKAHFAFMQAFARVKQADQRCQVDGDCLIFTYPYRVSSCPDKRFVAKDYQATLLHELTQAVIDNCKPMGPPPPLTCDDARVPVCDPAAHVCAGVAPGKTPR